MAKVEIDTPGVTIRIEDSGVSAEALGAQALVLYERASDIDRRQPAGPASGVQAERRGTPTHTDTNYHGIGFAPVKAEMGDTEP